MATPTTVAQNASTLGRSSGLVDSFSAVAGESALVAHKSRTVDRLTRTQTTARGVGDSLVCLSTTNRELGKRNLGGPDVAPWKLNHATMMGMLRTIFRVRGASHNKTQV